MDPYLQHSTNTQAFKNIAEYNNETRFQLKVDVTQNTCAQQIRDIETRVQTLAQLLTELETWTQTLLQDPTL